MTPQKPFHVRECAVQEIVGIRNAQLGILLKHKQAVQVPFQAEIRASKPRGGVAGLAGFGVLRAFVKKVLMPLEPCFQAAHLLGVKGVGFGFYFGNGQGLAADVVKQNHDAGGRNKWYP